MIDAHLSVDQQLDLLRIIRKYSALFDIRKHNMSSALHVKHSVDTEGYPVIRQMPYQHQHQDQNQVSVRSFGSMGIGARKIGL